MSAASGSTKRGTGAGPISPASRRAPVVAGIALAVAAGAAYLPGLHPGVAEGDAAELQWAGPQLAICHSPGYALQVVALKLFTALPLGGTAAWRANLMSAVFGVIGVLALYGAVRRLTGSVLAGSVSAATLAFSSVWWSHALVAEVYVFGGAFLLLALYATVRARQSGRAGWLALAAAALGVVVAERPSELLIAPAISAPWLLGRGRPPRGPGAWSLAAALVALPFAASVALNAARGTPESPAARDEVFREGLQGVDLSGEVTYPYTAGGGLLASARRAAAFGLGLTWSPRVSPSHALDALPKYLWLVSGAGAWGARFAPARTNDPLLRGGVTVGPPGLVLALLGAVRWRREGGWVPLGLGLVAGNLLFVSLYWAFDRMTFTVPAAVGLCFLAGLGCAAPPGPDVPARDGRRAAWLALPLALVAVNGGQVDRDTPQNRALVAQRAAIGRAPWPQDAVILSTYWPAMTYRYLVRVEAGREDVRVIHVAGGSHAVAARRLLEQGRTVFLTRGLLEPSEESILRAGTPEPWASAGLLRLDPPEAARTGGAP